MRLSKLGYYLAKIKQKLITHSPETISEFYRSGGMKIGDNTIICGYMPIGEPELLEIKRDLR